MAVFFRMGLPTSVTNGLCVRLCKALQINGTTQVARISSKVVRDKLGKVRPAPYPYKTKSFDTWWDQTTDPMVGRYDENSRIVVVEGPIAAGKDKFARKLAEALDMAYFPAPSNEDFYVFPYGFDIRSINSRLSEVAQYIDVETFLQNPKHKAMPTLETIIYHNRYQQYLVALLHVLSTGEGVVLNRSLMSSIVFIEAITNAGYLPPTLINYFQREIENMKQYLLRPHLVVYLDLSVDQVKERIKKRNIPYEANSKVLTTQFHSDIERIYKDRVLPLYAKHGHVLELDATKEVDMEEFVWDIEQMDFESTLEKSKMHDWIFSTVDDIRNMREFLQEEKNTLAYGTFNHEFVKDLEIPAEDLIELYDAVIHCSPELRYAPGYNKELGESYLFKGELTDAEAKKIERETMQRMGRLVK